VSLRRGEEGYVAGEETAILETLEGHKAWPRPKPPLPAAVGFRGRPTLVQNVETLSRVPAAAQDPEAFRRMEKTWVSLWGDVRRPGAYEVPLGTPLRTIVEDSGGGAPEGVGMLFPAGPSAAPLAADGLDTALDPDALRAAGSGLGTASLLVVGRSVCPLSVAASLASFFEREACNQCRRAYGHGQPHRVLRAVEDGRPARTSGPGRGAGFMSAHCAHGRGAASVTGLLAAFRPTWVTTARNCAAGRATPSIFPGRAALDSALGPSSRVLTSVFFHFLPTPPGALAALALVTEQAGAKFAVLSATAAFMTAVALALVYRRHGLAVGTRPPGGEAWPAVLALAAAALIAMVLYNRAQHFGWRSATRPLLGTALLLGVAGIGLSAPLPGRALFVASDLTSVVLLGAAAGAMILGHWYLVVLDLPISALRRLTVLLIVGLVLRSLVVAIVLLGPAHAGLEGLQLVARGLWSPDGIFIWMRLLFGIAGPISLIWFIWKTVEIRSTQSATGILYVQLFLVMSGELLAKYLRVAAGLPL
jgi:hypothetical protein